MYSKYKYKFYLNANHAIYINNELGNFHSHTWEMILTVKNFNEKFVQFNDVENIINGLLDKYQNKNINNIEPFNKINPTLENICRYFNELFASELLKQNIRLETIEICESPKRAFIIDNYDEIIYESKNEIVTEKINVIGQENDMIINNILDKYIQKK